MEIINHFIQTEQIIGIGPLMAENSKDFANATQLFFMLHCKNYSIKIESPVFKNNSNFETLEHNPPEKYTQFKKDYYSTAATIQAIIAPDEQTERVNAEFDALLLSIKNIFTKAEAAQLPIKHDIKQLISSLQHIQKTHYQLS